MLNKFENYRNSTMHVFGQSGFLLEDNSERLIKTLQEKGYTITTAESCTGGMISSTLVNVPGASDVLSSAYVTYANAAKEKILGVKHETLNQYGAVSAETAREMAEGAARAASSECAIAVTGIAGPDGGTKEKPVGTVYAGFFVCGTVIVERYLFSGSRYEVRYQTTLKTIDRIWELINNRKLA
ncbi:MAG: CinA family protein [Bacteroides sp.]|nr:CinA family protein [Bacteroides sp.]